MINHTVNLVQQNRNRLAESNYVRKAKSGTNYWYGFDEPVLNRYRERYGDDFNLIIPGDDNVAFDFYIIPFTAIKGMFVDDTISAIRSEDPNKADRRRWTGSIKHGRLSVSKGGSLDVSGFYGLAAVLKNPNLFDAETLSDAAVEVPEIFASPDGETTDDDELAFPEGRIRYRMHRHRERNPKLVRKKKAMASRKGALNCEVCSFDFFAAYGQIGEGYIECHHTLPIHEYESGQETRLQDLAIVCANCHRMLHRRRPWLTVDELSTLWLGNAQTVVN